MFNDLPVELVGAVVAEAVSIGDLLRLRAVNHTFLNYATPRAFTTFHVVNTPSSVAGYANLLQSTSLAPLVRRLVVHCEAEPGENKLVNRGTSRQACDLLHVLKRFDYPIVEEDVEARELRFAFAENVSKLAALVSLEELELDFFSGMVWQNFKGSGTDDMTLSVASPSKYFMLQTSIIKAITDIEPTICLPHLRSLHIANLIPFPAPEFQSDGFESLMGCLTNLTLSVHALRFSGRHGEDMYSWFWSEMLPERFLEPAQQKLTTLTLFSDQPVGQFPPVDLTWLQFPHLTNLSLNGFMFNEQRLVEDFIIRHGNTLQNLTLDTCPIHIGGLEGSPPRTWAVVLQRFTAKLTALLDFKIMRRTGWGLHEADPRIDLLSSYERCLTGYGYERGKDNKIPLSCLQADRVALRNLLHAVNTRRGSRRLPQLSLPSLTVTTAAS